MRKELNTASGGFNNSSGSVYRDEKPFVSRTYVRKREANEQEQKEVEKEEEEKRPEYRGRDRIKKDN